MGKASIMRKTTAILLAMFATTSPALAEVVATQTVEQEIVKRTADGAVKLERVTAVKVAPGDEVIYSIRFTNQGAEPAADLVMVMPVPDEVKYVEGSAAGSDANITFSADGGKTYLTRGRLTVKEEGVERSATSDEISHIKWVLAEPLASDGRGVVTYRGVVK